MTFISPLFTEKNYFSYLTASGLIERKHCIKLGKKKKKIEIQTTHTVLDTKNFTGNFSPDTQNFYHHHASF